MMRPVVRLALYALLAGLAGCASSPDDPAIQSDVREALANDPLLAGLSITADTYDHVVYLSGQVPTQLYKEKAARIAHFVPGVTGVQNGIIIENH